jgi:hypothetical protein
MSSAQGTDSYAAKSRSWGTGVATARPKRVKERAAEVLILLD